MNARWKRSAAGSSFRHETGPSEPSPHGSQWKPSFAYFEPSLLGLVPMLGGSIAVVSRYTFAASLSGENGWFKKHSLRMLYLSCGHSVRISA